MTNSTFRGLLGSLAVLSLLALGGCKTVDVAGADGKTTNQTTVFGLKLTPKPATADEIGADEDNPGGVFTSTSE